MAIQKKTENREKILNIRLTEIEYELLKEEADYARMPVSKYARHILQTKKPEVHYDLHPGNNELKTICTELHKIGINLNQIARHLNGGGTFTKEMKAEITEMTSDLFNLRSEIARKL